MIGWIKRKLVAGKVAGHRKDAMKGKLGTGARYIWDLLDGHKTWLVAIYATYKLVCKECALTGYGNAIIGALGWDSVAGAFDPTAAASSFVFLLATGHHALKAYRERQAGVPVEMVGKSVLDLPPAVTVAAVAEVAKVELKDAKAAAVVAEKRVEDAAVKP